MNFVPNSPSNLIPFPGTHSARSTPPAVDFSIAPCKILMKTRPHHPVTSAYGIELIDAVRMNQFHSEITFQVELRRDFLRQSLFCGLLSPTYTSGIGIAIDPITGAVMDLINGAAVIGYMSHSCRSSAEPMSVELRLQRFGRNLISSVVIDDDFFLYPAFLAGAGKVFQAMVGSDIDSGAVVSYRRPSLRTAQSAKAA